jgi:protein O-GlcNAc transferase
MSKRTNNFKKRKSQKKNQQITKPLKPIVQPPAIKQIQLAFQRHQAGELQQAEVIYRQVLQKQPNNIDALYLLGVMANQIKNYDVAIKLLQKTIEINNSNPLFYINLGYAFKGLGKLDEAVACYQRALVLNPNSVEAYNNLGNVLSELGKLDEAIKCYQRVLVLNPNYVETHNNLGIVFKKMGKLDEAMVCYQRALALKPHFAEVHNNLGEALKDRGMIDKAIEHYRSTLEINPTLVTVYSNFLLALNYAPDYDMATIFLEHKKFNEQYTVPLLASIQSHFNNRDSRKKLKIGYISADFYEHSLSFFMEPVLAQHSHEQFEIFCYYNNIKTDKVTQRLQQYADHWINCIGMSDEELAEKIRQAPIDILVDLMGYTSDNRILLYAHKPAPIQVAYLGYPSTTGLATMDYKITDHVIDPVGETEVYHTEKLIRLPTYRVVGFKTEESPEVNSLPALKSGQITFASFNHFSKINSFIISIWAKILTAISGARLLIVIKDDANDKNAQNYVKGLFVPYNVTDEQLEIVGTKPFTQYLKLHNNVDISLDPFPHMGGTTTFISLWMGVPVITLSGQTSASHGGSPLISLGLSDLIANTPEEYVEIAIRLASHLEDLHQLRMKLRDKMINSPLMDAKGFTLSLENAYREMWENWCHTI